jgi:hypothetical protein
MTSQHDDRVLSEHLERWDTQPPSPALSARVLARAHAALAEDRTAASTIRARTSWAVVSAVLAAVAVYLGWAVDFLVRLADT